MWAQDGGEDTNYTPSFSETEVIRVSGNRASAIVPATSADDNSHWYLVTQTRGYSGANTHTVPTPIFDNNGGIRRAAESETPTTFDGKLVKEKANYLVRFFEESDGLYYMQFANGRFIKEYDESNDTIKNVPLETTETFSGAGLYALYPISESSFGWNLHKKGGKRVDNNGAEATVAFWNSGEGKVGGNTEWFLYPVEKFEKWSLVTYHAIYNEQEKNTETITVLPGSEPSCPVSFLYEFVKPEGFYSDATCEAKITEITEDTHDIFVKLESPVTFSTSYEDATWYFANIRSSMELYYNTSNNSIACRNDVSKTDEAKWAFIGTSPYAGIKVINNGSGNKYLTHSGTTISWTEDKDAAVAWSMRTHPYDNNGFILYHIEGSTTYELYSSYTGGMNLITNGITAGNDGLDDKGNIIKGGCIEVTEVPDDYRKEVDAVIKPYFEESALNIYFGLSEEAASQIKSQYKYLEGDDECTEAQYLELWNAVKEAITYPGDGYYRIKNNDTGNYMGKENENGVATFKDGTTASTVGYLKRKNDGNYILSLQGTDSYPSLTIAIAEGTPGKASFANNNAGTTYRFLHDNNGSVGSGSIGQIDADPSAYWSVEDAKSITVSLNSIEGDANYYATLCVPFALTDNNGIAHTISVEGMEATPTSTGGTIEAGLPVLLMGSESTATFSIVPGTPAVATPVTSSGLTGTFIATTIDGAADYVLGTYGGRVGFFHWASSNLAANRAYIAASTLSSGNSTSEVKGFYLNFDEMTDGVAAVEEATTEAPAIYNLAGQRVAKAVKGIYVVNGKKMWVK